MSRGVDGIDRVIGPAQGHLRRYALWVEKVSGWSIAIRWRAGRTRSERVLRNFEVEKKWRQNEVLQPPRSQARPGHGETRTGSHLLHKARSICQIFRIDRGDAADAKRESVARVVHLSCVRA